MLPARPSDSRGTANIMNITERKQIESRLRNGESTTDAERQAIIDELANDLSNAVYKAALIYERAELMGLIHGNGHHMAQALAQEAVDRFKKGVEWVKTLPTPR